MNKEIIIDGCNVTDCMYFNDKNKKCRTFSYGDGVKFTSYKCEQDKNCYFKQLKRSQEENEKLKEKVNSYNCNANCYKYKEANKYTQALEEIREVLMACLEFKTCVKCKFQEKCKWDVEEFILTTINEVLKNET